WLGIPIVASALPSASPAAFPRRWSAPARARDLPALKPRRSRSWMTLRFRMTAAKPVPGARPRLAPVASFWTCQELTRKRANRIDGFFAARAGGLLRAAGAGGVKIAG